MDEIVIPPKRERGWPCPRCHGMKRLADGWCSVSIRPDGSTVIRGEPGTLCRVCNGKGRVLVSPVPDESPGLPAEPAAAPVDVRGVEEED